MKLLAILILALGIVMFPVSCADLVPNESDGAAAPADATYMDVLVGEDFQISLESFPLINVNDTWEATFDENALNLKNESRVPINVGGPILQIFTFTALAVGETDVVMKNEVRGTENFLIRVGENVTNIDVNVGDEIVIALDSNPTTGYMWIPWVFDWDVLGHKNETYVSYPSPSGWVGGGGRQIFTFVAETEGESYVDMIYLHPWAGGEVVKVRQFLIGVGS